MGETPVEAIRLRRGRAPTLATLALTLVAVLAASGGRAAPLPEPTGPVILTVDGSLDMTNAGGSAQFDLDMLDALPQVTIRTLTPWTEGETEFSGPRAADVLAAVGARGSRAVAAAINDYRVEIPLDDFTQLGVILATRRDGRLMRVRDKGPIWLIYPWSDRPELRTEIYHARSIWQLRTLTIK